MELISVHENTVTYYVYQFDYSCYYDCYYWWDAFQTSLIGAQGGTYETNQTFYPQGPPASRVPQSKTAYAQLYKRRTNRACKFPTGENSLFMLWSNWYPYAAHFAGQLQGPDNYTNRVVGETLQQLQGDTCWYSGSPYQPHYISYNPYGWPVGVQKANDIGVYSTLYNTFGMDTVGYTNTSAYYHYRTRMQQSGLQCGLTYTQQMRIDSCGGQYSHDYGIQHGLMMYINSSGATVTRKNATAGPKY